VPASCERGVDDDLLPTVMGPPIFHGPHRRRIKMPKRYPSSADTDAMVERVAPAILELLADGVPRSRRAIVAELADRHPKGGGDRREVRRRVLGRGEPVVMPP
jgi:hypothetical protein